MRCRSVYWTTSGPNKAGGFFSKNQKPSTLILHLCNLLGYTNDKREFQVPIKKSRHKGLKKKFYNEDKSGIQAAHANKIGLILDLLDAATKPNDIDFPGSDFHRLKGDLKDFYSVHINGNWTIIFKFENGDADEIDLIDYH